MVSGNSLHINSVGYYSNEVKSEHWKAPGFSCIWHPAKNILKQATLLIMDQKVRFWARHPHGVPTACPLLSITYKI